VLDDVAVGPFLEQPAGKHPPPILAAMIEHHELHESAGFLRILPLRGALARAQTHHRAPDPHALSRFQPDIPDEAVALVEQAQHRLALFHRSDTGIGILGAGRGSCLGQRAGVCGRWRRRIVAAIASGQRQRGPGQRQRCQPAGGCTAHAASGVHGW
jgi:hypothetical protein